MALYFSGDTINGSNGDDHILAYPPGSPDNTLYGHGGDDLIFGDYDFFFNTPGGSTLSTAYDITSNNSPWSTLFNPDVGDSQATPHASIFLESNGNYSWYSVDVSAGQTITLDVDYGSHEIGDSTDTVLDLYNPFQSRVASNDDASPALGGGGSTSFLDSYLTHTFATSGTYYIRVGEFGNTPIDAGEELILNVSLTGQAVTNASPVFGDDTIFGGTGNDVLYGLEGHDYINGEDHDDLIAGHDGNDTLNGGSGADDIGGGWGHDRINGQAGHDEINGHPGRDFITGGFGDDTILGGADADTINGNPGFDVIDGNTGDDTIFGGADDDDLIGGAGDDSLYGQLGRDTIGGSIGHDLINGGSQGDALSGHRGNDSIFGSLGADDIGGGPDNDFLHGGHGHDEVDGHDGSDTIYGYTGADTLRGGPGGDYVHGGDGFDFLAGGGHADTLRGAAHDDRLFGQDGNDLLFGDAGDDELRGGNHHDNLRGGDGNDTLFGDGGTDRFSFEDSWDDDVIKDFANDGLEKINLAAVTGVDSLSDLTFSNTAAGARIDYAGNSIVIEGLTVADLDSGDFIL